MMAPRVKVLAAVVLVAGSTLSAAATPSIVGRWQELDEDTKRPAAIIDIAREGDVYIGAVVRIFSVTGEDPNPHCTQCKGALKNQPVIGMRVIEGLRQRGNAYDGGTVTDPDTGAVYRVKLVPSADGETLAVTGYVGISLLGKTETWTRVAPAQ